MITKQTNKGIGSITNGEYKLEVQISQFTPHEYQKGQVVEVIGEVTERIFQNVEYSPFLRVTDVSKIRLLDEPKTTLQVVFDGYRYIELFKKKKI